MAKTKLPAAIKKYMTEFEETEQYMRDYILRQLVYWGEIRDQAASKEQWIAFKLGCTSAAAATAIKWAQAGK